MKCKDGGKPMSINRAKVVVRSAMKVIVDFMVGNQPYESCQSLYDKVNAVDDEVIKTLESADFKDDAKAKELHGLAKNIKAWAEDHLSFLAGEPSPQRWMFKTMV